MAKKRGNSEGSIYRMKDGRWRGAITVGYKPNKNGRFTQDRMVFSGSTRAEVAEQMVRLNRRLGVNHIVASVHWPGMPNSLALEQLEVLSREVMPQVRAA